jgi:cytoskeleton protein RodZ
VSRHGRRGSQGRQRSTRSNVERFPTQAASRNPEELDESPPILAGAMSHAHEECADDCPPPSLLPPGTRLRRSREARGLTLDDLSARTKIPKATLAAIENGDAARLPATIYTRGFVKVVAREVGLDPEAAADDYLASFEPRRADAADDRTFPAPRPARAPHAVPDDASRHVSSTNPVGRLGGVTTAVAVFGLILYVFAFSGRDDREQISQVSDRAGLNGDAVVASLDGADGGERADGVVAVNEPFELVIVPRGPCWVSVVVDGERVLARLLQTGERQTLTVDQEAVMRVGEPGALSISINGQPGRALGRPGQPVSVTITRDNFRDFLVS